MGIVIDGTTSLNTLQTSPEPVRPTIDGSTADEVVVFSLAFASAALEARAAIQLETNGATPANNEITSQENSPSTSQASDHNFTQSDAKYKTTENAQPRKPEIQSPPPPDSSVKHQHLAQGTNASVTPFIAPITSGLSAGSQQNIAPQRQTVPTRAEHLVATSNEETKTGKAKIIRANLRQPTTAPNEFARLVAKKINERASAFDLRLDPPELGRVEGRFSIQEDGKTVLALTFDNQEAMDLFSRDADNLRLALAETGVDTEHSEFLFRVNEDNRAENTISLDNLTITQQLSPSIIGSNGVIDLWT